MFAERVMRKLNLAVEYFVRESMSDFKGASFDEEEALRKQMAISEFIGWSGNDIVLWSEVVLDRVKRGVALDDGTIQFGWTRGLKRKAVTCDDESCAEECILRGKVAQQERVRLHGVELCKPDLQKEPDGIGAEFLDDGLDRYFDDSV